MNPTKLLTFPLLALALALPFSGCRSSGAGALTSPAAAGAAAPEESATTEETLAQIAGRSWKLDQWVSADGSTRDPGPITFTIGEGNRIGGMAGVNRYMGVARLTEAGALDLTQGLVTTMMAGLPEAMERERDYLADLKQVNEVRLEDDRLVLAGNGVRLEFAAAR
ncbi:heat-shock protein [Opitutaceae bacterium TAV5]|nr:heat-shock protein [Opitutaceae bacterium TAV5]